ncbi:MAG: serine/threonine-protein kinase [Deltaproteobacteria bacterium]|nr:serine/threonine-protein kinase [Deltaproteobacteria bacterium]
MGEPNAAKAEEQLESAPSGGDLLIGRVINDRFKVLSLLARGGMGKVYRAEQVPLGRLCALKVLHPNYNGDQDPEFHKRFFLEASTSSKLRHQNTVTIFDYGQTDDGIYYMAMELLEGKTLHRLLREVGPLDAGRCLRIARQICRSLREAHGIGVIHRDLKPANIFLVRTEDEEDFVKVLDFGLVKQLDETGSENLTQTGLFMGSPKYMAPEQIRGERVTEATDVYALGVVLYEVLVGKVPFDKGNSVNTLMAHVSDTVPPIHVMNPAVSVPPAVADFVYKCLQKRPEDRFPTMDAMLEGLKLAGSGALGLSSTGEWATSGDISASSSLLVSLDQASGSGSIPSGVVAAGTAPLSIPAPALDPSRSAVGAQTATRASKRSPLIFVGIAIAALAAAGVVVASKSRTSHTVTDPSAGRTENTPAVTATGGSQGTTQVRPTNVADAAVTPTVEPVSEVNIALTSDPSDAEVFENDRSLGRTPLNLHWTGEQGNPQRMHTFVFRKANFLDAVVTLGGSEIRYAAHLNRRPVARPTNHRVNNVPSGYREW